MSRDDIATLLSKAAPSLSVKSLLDDLQQTVEFEVSIAKKWATTVSLRYPWLEVSLIGLFLY